MNLELRHLRVVVAIAENGSVTKAASALGLAQPALTAQLQRIERTLGGPLFERDRRGARATALGELVLARARVLLPAVQGLQDEAARLTGAAPAGRFRVGAVNGPIVGGLVHRLGQDQPGAQISTFASWSADELAEMVLAGRLDFALVGACGDAPVPAGVQWRVIAVDPVFVLLRQDHPAAATAEVQLACLAATQWVISPGSTCVSTCFAAACARAGFTPRSIYETDVRGAMDLVEAGAVALCQPTFRPMAGLVTRPLAGAPLRWRQLLGWAPDSPAAGYGERVLAFAIEAYLDSAGHNPAYLAWLADNTRFGPARPPGGDAPAREPAEV